MSIINVDELKNSLFDAFRHRERPEHLAESSQLDDIDLPSINAFSGLNWFDVDEDLLCENFEVFSFFSKEAYCYYLPSVIKLTIENHRFDYYAVQNIVGVLDRSPNVEFWDEFFIERWAFLTFKELSVIENWLFFMALDSLNFFESGSLERAIETISLLKKNH